jgi:hypothetical protein
LSYFSHERRLMSHMIDHPLRQSSANELQGLV